MRLLPELLGFLLEGIASALAEAYAVVRRRVGTAQVFTVSSVSGVAEGERLSGRPRPGPPQQKTEALHGTEVQILYPPDRCT